MKKLKTKPERQTSSSLSRVFSWSLHQQHQKVEISRANDSSTHILWNMSFSLLRIHSVHHLMDSTASQCHLYGPAATMKCSWGLKRNRQTTANQFPYENPRQSPCRQVEISIATTGLKVKPCVLFSVLAYSNPLQPAVLQHLPTQHTVSTVWLTAVLVRFHVAVQLPSWCSYVYLTLERTCCSTEWGVSVFISPPGFVLVILKRLLAL